MNWREIEPKWQKAWREAKLFEAHPDAKPKFYLTVALPYVSGPMHVGHGRTYTVPDVIARYKRMQGFNVLFPMAYHFTGTPIVGAAKRIARREPEFVKVLIERYGIPEEKLREFENPHYFATYFARESDLSYRKGMERLGYSIDWRREFTTVDPHYSKFITWQYRKLYGAGLIVKGKHPVKWCPGCGNPVTDHDLLDGEGAEIVEFTLLKYRAGDYVLPAATLRPETVFGVTNLWLNPDVKYVCAEVDGEKWIVSEQAVDKLRQQGYSVGGVTPGRINFNEEVEVPLTHKRVPVLPARFVDPENATGVVGSVPSHAPYDYVALLELQQKPDTPALYGIEPSTVMRLKPISLIEVDGYGESPAVDVVNRMGIKNQTDPRLEDATSEVYRNEFARGRMRSWVPKYAGMQVSQAKQAVRDDMLANNEAAKMYEFSEKPVTCRCGTRVVVKVVEDQWFLNYADDGWKAKARDCLARMHLVPPETRAQYEHTIDWLHEWPCVTGDTIVFGDNLPISEITEENAVLTSNGGEEHPIATMEKTYRGEVVKLRVQGNPNMTITPEHPVLVAKRRTKYGWVKTNRVRPRGDFYYKRVSSWKFAEPKWVKASSVAKGDYVLVPLRKEFNDFRDEELAWLMGVYLAEGYVTAHSSKPKKRDAVYFSFGKEEKELINKTLSLLRKRFGTGAVKREKTSIKVLGFKGAPGFFSTLGRSGGEKWIPRLIKASPPETARAFIEGYVAGDGYKRKNTIEVTTSTRRMVLDLKEVLLRTFAIVPSVTVRENQPDVIEGRKVKVSPSYGISWSRNKWEGDKRPRVRYWNDENFLYVPVQDVRSERVDALRVYNLETPSQTYCIPFVVHNCTRSVGMGTPAPWDQKWIIESLSDSTIYMAYYTISHLLRTIDPEKLSDEVFDYIFLGKGDPGTISSARGIEREKLEAMRREFEYWYPMDYRMSANELISNHLTFHIFHHAVLFPDKCPRGIVTFGMAVLEGQKMSSSKGNIIAINEAVREHGADTVRLYLMSVAEPWQDLNWRAGEAAAMRKNLERFYALAEEIIALPNVERPSFAQPERWMLSRLQRHIEAVKEALDAFETRKAVQHAFFMLMQDLRWYMKRARQSEARAHMLKRVLDVWLRLLAPFVPHICEELWSRAGRGDFISTAAWPSVGKGLIDESAEMVESYIERILEDVGKIQKMMKIGRPRKVCLYVAQDWKWRAYRIAMDYVRAGRVDFGKLLSTVEEKLELRLHKADLSKYIQQVVRELRGMSEKDLNLIAKTEVDEFRALFDATDFIREQLGAEVVHVFKADDATRYDPQDRAKLAVPLRPAIFVE